MNDVTMDEARKNFVGLVQQVSQHERGPVAITVDGEEVAVILSRSEYEALDTFREEHEFEAVFEDLKDAVKSVATMESV